MSNSALSGAQFKGLARNAFEHAREHRLAGDLNSADEAMRFGAQYRELALYGTRPNGGSANPDFMSRKTTHRRGDMPSNRVLP